MTVKQKANILVRELQRECIPNVQLYRSGNMRSSIHTVEINEDKTIVLIAVNYASKTNEKGRNEGWIKRVSDRVVELTGGGVQVAVRKADI